MSANKQKSVEKVNKDIIIWTLMAQLDAIVCNLSDHCCISNYYGGQRKEIIADLKRLSYEMLTDAAGLDVEYDITGSNYKEDDSDLPLVGDTIDISLVMRTETSPMIPLWNGHLKYELRGMRDSHQ